MQQVQELVLVKAPLNRMNVVSLYGYGVHTEAQVPEPSTLVLLGLALTGLVVCRLRRRGRWTYS